MRILMLTQFYPPKIGGEERHVYSLSSELAARGHDVTVATLWKEGLPEFECHQGVRIHRIRGSMQRVSIFFTEKENRHLPPFPDPEVLWALRSIIKRERPEIVHAHNWIVHSFTPLKTWSKAKLVVSLCDCSLTCVQKRFMNQQSLCSGPALTKCLQCSAQHYGIARGLPILVGNWAWGKMELQSVDMFLPVSQAIAQANRLAYYGVPHRVIPNFIPDDVEMSCVDTNPLLAQLPRGNYLLFVGNIGYEKGVDVLLKAYAEIESPPPLVLIGRPGVGFPGNIPPNVQILQSWPHSAIMSAWSRCTIGLVPSICLEAFGIVALEAMVRGRPIIASRIGGLTDVVADGETGLLVPPGDCRSLRQAIQRLLADSALREHMGTVAKKRVVEFQARSVVPRYEQVYQELLQL